MFLSQKLGTVETLYSTIYYSKYFIELKFDKSTQYIAFWTLHNISPFRASYEVSSMSTSTEIDRVIKGFYCISSSRAGFTPFNINQICYFLIPPYRCGQIRRYHRRERSGCAIVNTMAVDALTTQGARTSAVMTLTHFSQNTQASSL